MAGLPAPVADPGGSTDTRMALLLLPLWPCYYHYGPATATMVLLLIIIIILPDLMEGLRQSQGGGTCGARSQ